jgi:hypothetical protein
MRSVNRRMILALYGALFASACGAAPPPGAVQQDPASNEKGRLNVGVVTKGLSFSVGMITLTVTRRDDQGALIAGTERQTDMIFDPNHKIWQGTLLLDVIDGMSTDYHLLAEVREQADPNAPVVATATGEASLDLQGTEVVLYITTDDPVGAITAKPPKIQQIVFTPSTFRAGEKTRVEIAVSDPNDLDAVTLAVELNRDDGKDPGLTGAMTQAADPNDPTRVIFTIDYTPQAAGEELLTFRATDGGENSDQVEYRATLEEFQAKLVVNMVENEHPVVMKFTSETSVTADGTRSITLKALVQEPNGDSLLYGLKVTDGLGVAVDPALYSVTMDEKSTAVASDPEAIDYEITIEILVDPSVPKGEKWTAYVEGSDIDSNGDPKIGPDPDLWGEAEVIL